MQNVTTIASAAAQVLMTVIPIVGIVMGSLVVFFYLLWHHRQKMFMIEKGIYRKIEFDISTFSLFTGLLLMSIGGSLVVFFIIKSGFSYGVLSGLIPFAIGLSQIVFFVVRLRVHHK